MAIVNEYVASTDQVLLHGYKMLNAMILHLQRWREGFSENFNNFVQNPCFKYLFGLLIICTFYTVYKGYTLPQYVYYYTSNNVPKDNTKTVYEKADKDSLSSQQTNDSEPAESSETSTNFPPTPEHNEFYIHTPTLSSRKSKSQPIQFTTLE